jgi:hypothetical protein
MSHLARAQSPAKTPIERIFEKVVHRKMTSQERIYFHLGPHAKAPPKAGGHKHTQAA